MRKETIIFLDKGRGSKLKRRAKVIGEIVKQSAVLTLEDEKTHMFAGAVTLHQALKYKGDYKAGVKGGLAAYGVLIGANVIQNFVRNIDTIKEA